MKSDPTRTKTIVRSAERAVSASVQRFWIIMKPAIISSIEKNRSKVEQSKNTTQWIKLSAISEIEHALEITDERLLRTELKRTTRKYITIMYKKGGARAESQINKIGIDYHFDLTRGDIEAIGVLADQGFIKMKSSTEFMRSEYTRIISKGMLEGHGIPKMVKAMMLTTGKTKAKCRTIARTETLNAYNQGAINQYRKAGIKKWEWITAFDERTCQICSAYDGRIFNMGDQQPPIHPNCRCAVAPIVT